MARINTVRRVCFLVALGVAAVIVYAAMVPPPTDHPRRTRSKTNTIVKNVVFPQAGGDVTFNQPWTLAPIQLINDIEDITDSQQRYIVGNFSYSKGLGNLMFQYASLRSLAEKWHAKVILPESCLLRRAFATDALFVTDSVVDTLISTAQDKIVMTDCCSFRPSLVLFAHSNVQVIEGYLQNRLWFNQNENLIRDQFTFLPEVQSMANAAISSIKLSRVFAGADKVDRETEGEEEEYLPVSHDDSDVRIVGVHIRRGIDVTLNQRNKQHGHTVAEVDYYNKAMSAWRKKGNAVFVICSDDEKWAKKHLKEKEKGEFFFCPGRFREVDLALLSSTDALILSTGTFGWWAGWLAESRQTTYFSGWPAPGSVLDSMINKTQFFPPAWKAMQ